MTHPYGDVFDKLFKSLVKDITVWMSHGDQVVELPAEFESLAFTRNCPYAAVKYKKMAFYGVQFHPEVTHTPSFRITQDYHSGDTEGQPEGYYPQRRPSQRVRKERPAM